MTRNAAIVIALWTMLATVCFAQSEAEKKPSSEKAQLPTRKEAPAQQKERQIDQQEPSGQEEKSPAKEEPPSKEPEAPEAPAKKGLSKKELAAAQESARELWQKGHYGAARDIYSRIATATADSQAALDAQLQIARSYVAEKDYPEALKQFEHLLAEADRLPPEQLDAARAGISSARLALATKLRESFKRDQAIAVAQQVVDDEDAKNADVRLALHEIARNHLGAERQDTALATYRQLLKRPAVSDALRLEDIVTLTDLDPSAVEQLQTFLADHPGADAKVLARARYELGDVYRRLGQTDKAAKIFEELTVSPKTPAQWVRSALVGKAKLALERGDRPGAIAIYENIVSRPVGDWPTAIHDRQDDINRLSQLAPRADLSEEYARLLSSIHRWGQIGLCGAIPNNDVFLLAVQPRADDLVRQYMFHLRRTKGRSTPEQLQAVRKQLEKGGSARFFTTTPFSKKVAEQIADDAPLAAFLKPLLAGDHQAAAHAAWRLARLAENEADRSKWIEGVAMAVRCQDQCLTGREQAFLKWVYDDDAEGPNPLAEYLGEQPLQFEPSAAAVARAVDHLNRIESPGPMNDGGVLLSALPKGDVLRVGLQTLQAALDDYRLHLWRSMGKAHADQVAAARAQLVKGGDVEPFSVSEASKKLGAALLDEAPLANYLKPLLAGEHLVAAKTAWKNARLAKNNADYTGWLNAVMIALRCQDQSYARGQQLLDWSQGKGVEPQDHDANSGPVPGVLTLEPIPFKPDADARKKLLQKLSSAMFPDNRALNLQGIVPGNDVIQAVVNVTLIPHLDNRYLIYKRAMWRTQGRVLPAQFAAMKRQLEKGGKLRPFVVSAESKELSKAISDQAPLSDYYQPLFAGNHQQAAQVAWERARLTEDASAYGAWIQATALAIACHDQCAHGRSADFLQWIRGDLKGPGGKQIMENPAGEFLEGDGDT